MAAAKPLPSPRGTGSSEANRTSQLFPDEQVSEQPLLMRQGGPGRILSLCLGGGAIPPLLIRG